MTVLGVCLLIGGSCGERTVSVRSKDGMPEAMIWAWERPEDLSSLDAQKFGVAFLAGTLTLSGPDVDLRPRRQPLQVADGAYLIAVTRIETQRSGDRKPAYSQVQIDKIVSLVSDTLTRPGVKAIQIDFDAVLSERDFYRRLVKELKAKLPAGTPLSITALASWCIGDDWFNDLPIDEAVPMAFSMGADSEKVRSFLRNGNDWTSPLCRGSYGLSVDDPVNSQLKPGRRKFYFKTSAWNAEDLGKLQRSAD